MIFWTVNSGKRLVPLLNGGHRRICNITGSITHLIGEYVSMLRRFNVAEATLQRPRRSGVNKQEGQPNNSE